MKIKISFTHILHKSLMPPPKLPFQVANGVFIQFTHCFDRSYAQYLYILNYFLKHQTWGMKTGHSQWNYSNIVTFSLKLYSILVKNVGYSQSFKLFVLWMKLLDGHCNVFGDCPINSLRNVLSYQQKCRFHHPCSHQICSHTFSS